jgi:hypothetical protein
MFHHSEVVISMVRYHPMYIFKNFNRLENGVIVTDNCNVYVLEVRYILTYVIKLQEKLNIFVGNGLLLIDIRAEPMKAQLRILA